MSTYIKNVLNVIFFTTLILSCRQRDFILIYDDSKFEIGTPPGTVHLQENIFIDKYELSNISWEEYLADLELKFGFGSEEYMTALPDPTVWNNVDSSNQSNYYSHWVYREYPIVGVSYLQATKYSEWRTNRVMQVILYRNGILPYDSLTSPTFNLTVERFYTDSMYSKYHHIPYPHYELVPINLIPDILKFSDSLNTENIKSCNQRSLFYKLGTEDVYCEELIHKDTLILNLAGNSERSSSDKTNIVNCYTCKEPVVFHLYGNVSEMVDDSTVCFGGSWKDSIYQVAKNPYSKNTTPNCWTGFRNICTWKYYN